MTGEILNALHIRAILDAVDKKQIVTIQFEEYPTCANGLLLGVDFIDNEILISDTHPDIRPLIRHKTRRQKCWMKIKQGGRYLNLGLIITKLENGLILAQLLSANWTQNKRWHNRAEFQRLKGPSVRINQEFAPNLEARLRNLSANGAAIDIWGKELNRQFAKGSHIECTLTFNKHFEIVSQGQILDSRFIRKPSCHTQIRIAFEHLDNLSFSQLLNFVEASSSLSHAA